ncbi:shikimate dehydrogenase [Salirhabdus salicampi]|uniref:shikimate dehydrogenase n=1 Tax=Salirhabdus salicampi TaxID=476102 RepID=UPI0020C2F2F4|nr:shikimate dehydrogenase [Salirhabdus salicampi]MCP8616934.1 shikimate dehydrogenase [Salirhabdus salicampi]
MGLLLGVIGNPIKHSLSPWIHGHFLQQTGEQGIYRPFDIGEDKLDQSVDTLRLMGIDGFNVTVPYKEKIMKYVDELDKSAKAVQAVNTVVQKDGKWIGYNTDGKGYVHSLQMEHPNVFRNISNSKILLIGAGGAAKGIVGALLDRGFQSIDLTNRTVEKAQTLLQQFKLEKDCDALTLRDAEKRLNEYDLVIQTTKVGMTPNEGMQPIKLQNIRKNTIFSDIVYNPIETTFLQNAKSLGAQIHHGHGMLLYQAAYAYQLWTGIEVDPKSLLQPLEQKLKGGS